MCIVSSVRAMLGFYPWFCLGEGLTYFNELRALIQSFLSSKKTVVCTVMANFWAGGSHIWMGGLDLRVKNHYDFG